MIKFSTKLLFIFIVNTFFLKIESVNALIPYYYLPTLEHLEKESLSIGKNAYQLLYFGQIKEALHLAKLAVKINKSDEKLWLILSEAQISNNLYKDALSSLKKAEEIDPNISEIYFAKSSIYLKWSQLFQAKNSIETGLKIDPNNNKAIFQLGNIYLMLKEYDLAIKNFKKAVEIKPDFWQAINNQGLAYYEIGKINQAIKFFEKAILIEDNAEPLLGLASSLREKNINLAISFAKKALIKNPNYVLYEYRKEQLWGEKLQTSTQKLFANEQLKEDINMAKSQINKTN